MLYIGAGMNKIYIEEIHLIGFGKFVDNKISFSKDFNLIYGLNESGKTTIKSFIEGMFYGFDEGKNRINFSEKREIYRPKSVYKYAGTMLIRKNNDLFRLYRNFDNGEYSIENLASREFLETKPSDLSYPGKYFLGIDYDIYKSYVSFSQNQDLSKDRKKKILEKINNSDIDYNFSIKNSIEILDKRLADIGSERAYTKPYAKCKESLAILEKELFKIKDLKKEFEEDYQILDNKKDQLKIKTKKLDELKLENEFYNKKRNDYNYKAYKEWTDKLLFIEEKIAPYSYLRAFEEDDFEEIISDGNRKNIYIYVIFALFIIFLSLISKKYFLLILIVPILFLYFKNQPNDIDLTYFGVNTISEYNKMRQDYKKYQNLRLERENILEVIEILKKQDLDRSFEDLDMDFDFENYDNISALEKIKDLEKDINNLKDYISQKEKSILTIDNQLKNELSIRDEYRDLTKKLADMDLEKKAINIAKKKIMEIEAENNKDLSVFDKRLRDTIYTLIKKSYDVKLDKNLKTIIKDMDGNIIEVNQLSQGFFDQVNFSMRLSFLVDILNGGFIIFDDAFINYDIDRLSKALYILLDLSDKNQIIYFTCHKREEEIFDAESIEINKIYLEDL